MESERQTRRERIDPALRSAGWDVKPFDPALPPAWANGAALEEYPTEAGPADYTLCAGGQRLGIVEAKRLAVGAQHVLSQAERYARAAVRDGAPDFDGYRVPFLYSTNGETIWFRDARHPLNRARKLARFHTPDALREMFARDDEAAFERLARSPNDHMLLRPYQREADFAIERALARRERAMLVAMATGTGKTFTIVNEIYRLMRAGLARRVLFLVDRRALAAQAVKAFASFEPERGLKFDRIYETYSQSFRREDLEGDAAFDPKRIPPGRLTNPQPGDAFVYVCTIQRMAMHLFGRDAVLHRTEEAPDDDVDRENIPIHLFDLIVADECHRGYTSAELSLWRATLEHFDGVKIGLTATPAKHTTALFGEPVYRYGYDRAVAEGYLVDYDAVRLRSDVRMNGVFLREGEEVGMVDTASGAERRDYLEDEREYKPEEVEEKVTSPESNRKIIAEIKVYADEHERRYGRFPKTLVFADNDLPHVSHADQLVAVCREAFGRGDAFVQKITGRVDRPLQRIREFRNRPDPGIVVTVDLLTTGVDIPDLEFIVLLRAVRSRILFEQMLGRGTRKGERHPDKSHFVVFDCFDGTLLRYFRDATGMTNEPEPPQTTSRTIREIVEDIWNNCDRDYNAGCLVKRLRRVEREMSGKARELFAAFIPDGDIGRFANELKARLRTEFAATMILLRDERFQNLLVEFPRPERRFVVAYEAQDEVSSERLLRDGSGREHKPDDYLRLFAEYVKGNRDRIAAIKILLDRPREWNTGALNDLRERLAKADGRFTGENLERAHRLRYDKALADIISMVKHAASEEEPLLTAEERVERALARVAAEAGFTDEQRLWLDRIRAHAAQNLTLEQDDFDTMPIFTQAGGWGRARRVFGDELPELIRRINEAIAA